jgi:chitin synthase
MLTLQKRFNQIILSPLSVVIFYFLAIPIFGFAIPIYSFWHMDDFSWGSTRSITKQGKKKNSEEDGDSPNMSPVHLPSSRVPDGQMYANMSWTEFSAARQEEDFRTAPEAEPHLMFSPSATPAALDWMSDADEMMSQYSGSRLAPAGRHERGRPTSMLSQGSTAYDSSYSMYGNGNIPVASLPTQEQLANDIAHILHSSDLMQVTKKNVRLTLESMYGVDLSSYRYWINTTIDEMLSSMMHED